MSSRTLSLALYRPIKLLDAASYFWDYCRDISYETSCTVFASICFSYCSRLLFCVTVLSSVAGSSLSKSLKLLANATQMLTMAISTRAKRMAAEVMIAVILQNSGLVNLHVKLISSENLSIFFKFSKGFPSYSMRLASIRITRKLMRYYCMSKVVFCFRDGSWGVFSYSKSSYY